MPILRLSIGATVGLFVATLACAQTPAQRAECEREYAPQSGQPGKDVVWVPSPDHLVTAMLEMAKVSASDLVYDLGAGDGKIAIAAAKQFGARAVGVEFNPKLVKLADCLVAAAGVGEKVKMIHGDIFKIDFSEATVVTLYLLPELNVQLRPTLLKMKPGTRIVSHSFVMGDWSSDERILVHGADYIYFWVIPASVQGNWIFQAPGREPLTVRLRQKYQEIEGAAIERGGEVQIQNTSLRGREIAFTYVGSTGAVTLEGTVQGDEMNVMIFDGQRQVAYSGKRSK